MLRLLLCCAVAAAEASRTFSSGRRETTPVSPAPPHLALTLPPQSVDSTGGVPLPGWLASLTVTSPRSLRGAAGASHPPSSLHGTWVPLPVKPSGTPCPPAESGWASPPRSPSSLEARLWATVSSLVFCFPLRDRALYRKCISL